ncbi:hypothetical protein FACS189431_4460 [Alphaproteobacteria bacterium]|nr:hypothetical protein FACS189431_4460 [Alphaproteobacteria bacterium]
MKETINLHVKSRDLSKVSIESERLILWPVSHDLNKQMLLSEFNENVTRWLLRGPNENIEGLDGFLMRQIAYAKAGTGLTLAILDKDGEFIGLTELHRTNTFAPEFGLWLKESAWGQGFGTEAIFALFAWASKNLDVDYFKYRADAENIGSWKIAEKLVANYGGEFLGEKPELMRGRKRITKAYHILPKK